MTQELKEALDRELDAALESGDAKLIEQWRSIDGYDGNYLVSSMGRVISLPNNHHRAPKIMKLRLGRGGYLRVGLVRNGKQSMFFVHRLVAGAFIPNVRGCPQVNHIDENKKNNCVENLEWVTAKENTNYGTARARTSAKQKNNVHPCPVIQKTLDGMEVARYVSCSDIPRLTKFKRTGVVECLRGRIQTAYGYKWEYATKPWKEMV